MLKQIDITNEWPGRDQLAARLEKCIAPAEEARCIPPACYTDNYNLRRQQRRLVDVRSQSD